MSILSRARSYVAASVVLGGLVACDDKRPSRDNSDDSGLQMDAGATLTREQLLNPETCKSCHPTHYREWSGSMHAYSAEDPVFLAMNRRGQRETNGKLGDFCVNCHAPMAVREGATKDGLNLQEVPSQLKGVTCYFCHNAVDVEGDHNGKLKLANDTTMRGALSNAVTPRAHGVEFSTFHDRRSPESSRMCGACHDVVTPSGVHLERTFKEYATSAFSREGAGFQSCQTCHMDGRPGKAARGGASNLPDRVIHEHMWPGVDVALTSFPDQEAHRIAVECALSSSSTIVSLGARPSGEFNVAIETEAGHAQPSGTSQDRRLWVEFIAYDAAGNVIYQSGAAGDDDPEPEAGLMSTDPKVDGRPTLFFDRIYNAQGKEVHMFWDAEKSTQYPEGYASNLLIPPAQFANPHTVFRTYTVPGGLPERVTVRLRMRPISHVILEDLVASGDLDPAIISKVPTFTLYGTVFEWTRKDGLMEIRNPERSPLRCPDDYRCLLNPSEEGCASGG